MDTSSGTMTSNWMRNHHTSHHLHISFADTDTKDCHLEQPPQEKCFSAISMRFSKIYPMYLAFQMTY